MTTSINEFAAWFGILGGILSGSIAGLGFKDEHWLGGYGSWRRRQIRLGHVSFFGIAFLNLSLALDQCAACIGRHRRMRARWRWRQRSC